MATRSSVLAWRSPWTEEPGRLHSPQGRGELDTTEATWQAHTQVVTLAIVNVGIQMSAEVLFSLFFVCVHAYPGGELLDRRAMLCLIFEKPPHGSSSTPVCIPAGRA